MVKIKKFQVKIRTLKLEVGVDDNIEAFDGLKMMAIKMKWKGEPKFGLVPFHYKQKKDVTSRRIVKKLGPANNSIEWNNDGDEFENVCCFTEVSGCYQSLKYSPWDVSFNVLYSNNLEAKMVVIGKMVVNVAEMASKMVSEVEEKLPITLNIGRVSISATLHVKIKFAEIRDVQDSAGCARDSNESSQLQSLAKSKSLCDRKAQKENQLSEEESSTFEAVEPKTIESGSMPSLETQADSVNKVGWFSWKRRRLSLKPTRSKAEPLIKKSRSFSVVSRFSQQKVEKPEPSTESRDKNEGSSTTSAWEVKELQSRDGQTRLKTNVFFASFDQCSDKAAGESACTALVAVISHWLQSNRDAMPTRSEFDNLILHGSSEWRKLCQSDTYINVFPNKHFDLETILRAGIRPIAISHDQSFVGFFSPEKFESLQGVMSFDQIWDKISSIAEDTAFEPRVYIISWNDHFFVLKVEANAYYIIDTLGERLFEGCNKAYILKFDDNSTMYEKVNAEEKTQKNDTKAKEEIICDGKECCREFINRFLAAIPLKELEEQEKKETVSYFSLHHRLQIEFNSSYLLSSSSSSLTSSPFSSSATSTPSYL
ncbi:uncharacterized protein LOC107827563 isoform X1 [Nicotiana tabacum]|uniref:Uncharacterized protein LOC107827563 isoform X1 n=3 Tax=Nicotiana tabacum TaxID=4097 RepID=A0A1S4D9S6_TOBAC|nr:PREDICTED: uncharacterized protein LOC107827563 isoform X1 [Nicotiana tabacum]